MKKLIFTFFLITHVLFLTAQNNTSSTDVRTLTKLDIGFQGVGFSVEPKISHNTTIDVALGAGGFYEVWRDNFKYEWNFTDPAFYASITPKFYYNRTKRLRQGKTTNLNSGNYIGIRIKYTTGSIINEDGFSTILMNVHWGMQRSLGRKWIFNTNLGAGYATSTDDFHFTDGSFYPVVDIKFAYVFSKVNRN
jgi:hypothetical protein